MSRIEDLEAAKQLIEMQLKDIDSILAKSLTDTDTFWEDFTTSYRPDLRK